MADTKVDDMGNITTPSDDDLLYLIDDPAGTPADGKITWANVKATLLAYFAAFFADVDNQSFTSQTSVEVTHSSGKYPLVQVIDNSGEVILPQSIIHSSVNVFTVTFSSSTTGNIIYSKIG